MDKVTHTILGNLSDDEAKKLLVLMLKEFTKSNYIFFAVETNILILFLTILIGT